MCSLASSFRSHRFRIGRLSSALCKLTSAGIGVDRKSVSGVLVCAGRTSLRLRLASYPDLHKTAIVGRAYPSTVITVLLRRLIRSFIGGHITAARVREFLGFTIAVGFTGLIDIEAEFCFFASSA
jgi:hypothetical protein